MLESNSQITKIVQIDTKRLFSVINFNKSKICDTIVQYYEKYNCNDNLSKIIVLNYRSISFVVLICG